MRHIDGPWLLGCQSQRAEDVPAAARRKRNEHARSHLSAHPGNRRRDAEQHATFTGLAGPMAAPVEIREMLGGLIQERRDRRRILWRRDGELQVPRSYLTFRAFAGHAANVPFSFNVNSHFLDGIKCQWTSIIARVAVDLQPHLIGELVELRPLRAEDWNALFAVARDPLIWEQHPAKDRCKEVVFRQFFKKALDEVNCAGGAFAVIDRATSRIIGSTRFANFDSDQSEVEIGWTFLARSHWGGYFNGQMKRLMLDHAFRFVDTVYFLIGPDNIRSQKAVEKIGGIRAGLVEKPDANGILVTNVKYFIAKAQWR